MKDTLAEINELKKAGLIGQWAIGGAMGATFYLEPIATYDLDVFVLFEEAPLILTLTPIYDFLTARGHQADDDAIKIHGWPVQFLPAESGILKEAVEEARSIDFEGTPARVMEAEHLMTIALQTGRGKDYARLLMFVEAQIADMAKFQSVRERYGLAQAWVRFERNYLNAL